MDRAEGNTVQEISDSLGVSKSTIYRWIRNGEIDSHIVSGHRYIIISSEFASKALKILRGKQRSPHIPAAIKQFNKWHEVIDELCWLFKVCYNSKKDIKRKSFRLDLTFFNYLTANKVSLDKLRQVFETNQRPRTRFIINDLKRGWYNEIAYLMPLKKSTLGLSFSDISLNQEISNSRFAFPSWKITNFYYSLYFYLRAVTLQKVENFRVEEHKATISNFKSSVAQLLEKAVWKYPLNISYMQGVKNERSNLLLNQLEYRKYSYCRHPREPRRSPDQIDQNIRKFFKSRARRWKRPAQYTIFDFFLEFRIWANYLDIDNLLNLWGPGYRTFMDQNLSQILFFVGGISELCFLSIKGSKAYLKELQRFYDLLATNNNEFQADFVNTAIFQRLIIYDKMGFIDGKFELITPPNINEIRL